MFHCKFLHICCNRFLEAFFYTKTRPDSSKESQYLYNKNLNIEMGNVTDEILLNRVDGQM